MADRGALDLGTGCFNYFLVSIWDYSTTSLQWDREERGNGGSSGANQRPEKGDRAVHRTMGGVAIRSPVRRGGRVEMRRRNCRHKVRALPSRRRM